MLEIHCFYVYFQLQGGEKLDLMNRNIIPSHAKESDTNENVSTN